MKLVSKFRVDGEASLGSQPAQQHPMKPLSYNTLKVAELSSGQIENMSREEIIQVIHAAQLQNLSGPIQKFRLPFYDRATLQRLAFVARHACQNRGSLVEQ